MYKGRDIDTSSSWRETELMQSPSIAVPGKCAPISRKDGWGRASWPRVQDGTVVPGMGGPKTGTGSNVQHKASKHII